MKRKTFAIKVLSVLLAASLLMTVSGCGNKLETGLDETIELIEPVGVAKSYVNPEYRNIYVYETYNATVCPAVSEKSYEVGVNFSSYAHLPGESVKKGDALVNGDTAGVDEEIKKLRESMADAAENYEEQVKKLTEQIEKDKNDYEYKLGIFEKLSDNPVAEPSFPDDNSAPWQAYKAWSSQYRSFDASHRYAELTYEKDTLRLKETKELYSLDYNYNSSRLKDLRKQRAEKVLYSDTDGTVLSMNYYEEGNWINKNSPVITVGDLSVKELKCKFVSKSVINLATDVYALVNGERFEVDYQAISSDEYKRLSERDGTVYSTFLVEDPENKVDFGDFAVIVVVSEKREGVLCVPKASVAKDDNGQFVYVYDGDKYVETYVQTGLSDGMFTEILSGVTAKDAVKADLRLNAGANTGTVNRTTVRGSFSSNAYVFYSATVQVKNPIVYGTTYVDEVCVRRNDNVKKGDVLLKIHVIADTIEIERQERYLSRENARLQELINAGEEDNKDAIKAKKETIAELKKLISDMKKDAATVEIKAEEAGIITEITSLKAGDILAYKASVARIADETSCFMVAEDNDGILSYGNTVTISYSDINGNTFAASGDVVTVSPMAVSGALRNGYALIKIAPEDMSKFASLTASAANRWGRIRFNLQATVRKAENVLKVPKAAVTVVSGNYYVTVKDSDGNYKYVSFIVGGQDIEGYWVAEGLTEGMTICWE